MFSRVASIHEAAHCTAYLVQRGTCATIHELVVFDDGSGLCSVRHRANRTQRTIALLCGYAAEQRLQHAEGDLAAAAGDTSRCRSDFAEARAAIVAMGVDADSTLLLLWNVARRLVDQHWLQIERLARALQERGHLDGDEVAALWRGEAQCADAAAAERRR